MMGLCIVENVGEIDIVLRAQSACFALLGAKNANPFEFQWFEKRTLTFFGKFRKSDVEGNGEKVFEFLEEGWRAKLFNFVKLNSEQGRRWRALLRVRDRVTEMIDGSLFSRSILLLDGLIRGELGHQRKGLEGCDALG
jgi:hypothetical protein